MRFRDIFTFQLYELIRFGATNVTKPYEFIGFVAMDVTKPYEFIGLGAMDIRIWPLHSNVPRLGLGFGLRG